MATTKAFDIAELVRYLDYDGTSVTITSNTAFDTSTLYIDSLNNRVGIGNTTPTDSLHVTGTVAAGNTTITGFVNASSHVQIGTQSLTTNATHILIGTAELAAANGMLFARQEDIDTAVANLVASAPGTLDTLNEIATALGSDPDLANTLTTSIATKAANSYVNTELALKAPLANPTFTGNATFDSTTLFVDGTNDRVGVGLISPNYPLEVAGASTVSIAYQRTGVSAKKWGFHSDNDATYWQNITDSTLPLTITNNGNVGIGITNPSGKLHINSTQNINDGSSYAAKSAPLVIGNTSSTSVMLLDGNQIESHEVLHLQYNSGNDISLVQGGGSVGIGTTTPDRQLEVYGTQDGYMKFDGGRTDNHGYTIGSDQYGFLIYDDTASVYRLVIDQDTGYVGLNNQDPQYRLDITGNGEGINLSGGNNRIYFSGYRGLEGASDGSSLQVG